MVVESGGWLGPLASEDVHRQDDGERMRHDDDGEREKGGNVQDYYAGDFMHKQAHIHDGKVD